MTDARKIGHLWIKIFSCKNICWKNLRECNFYRTNDRNSSIANVEYKGTYSLTLIVNFAIRSQGDREPRRKFRKHRVCCVYACVHLETRIDAHAYVYGAVIIRFQCVKGDGVPRENGLGPSSWLASNHLSSPWNEFSFRLKNEFLLSRAFSPRPRRDKTLPLHENSATNETNVHIFLYNIRCIALADRNSTVGSACRA